MSFNSTTRVAGPFIGDDATTVFNFAFKVFAAADVLVVEKDADGIETAQTLTTNYSVTLNADQNNNPGGYITTVDPLASDFTLTISSKVEETQPLVLRNQGAYYPKNIEDALDRNAILSQQLANQTARAMTIPLSDGSSVTTQLPTKENRANKGLKFDSNGNVTVTLFDPDTSVEAASIYADAASSSATAAAASAAAAAASYDSFDDRYLGSKTADPTVDNDGNALLTGALYWNSVSAEMRAYDGSAWQVSYNPSTYTAPYTGAVGRTYSGKFKDVVSIEDFSSSYSSSADHTTLVQAAIDAVTNETVPPCLMVGNRRWNVGNIKCKTGLTLVGGGVGSGYFYLVNGTNNHMFTLDSDSVRSVQFKDFLINGNQANNTTGNGIFFNYTVAPSNNAKIRVENIHVGNAPEDSFGFGYGAGRDSWVRNCNSYFAGRYGMRIAAADMMVDGFNAGQSGNSGVIISSSGVHMSNVKAWLSGRLTTGSGNGVGICVDSTANVKGVQLNNLWTQENIGEAALMLFSHGTSILSGVTVNGLHSENDNGAIVKLVSGSGGYNRYNSIKNVSYGDSGLSQDPENFVAFNGSGTEQNYVELVKTDWSSFTTTDIVSVSGGAVNGANQFDIIGRPSLVTNTYAASFTPDVFSCANDLMTLTGNVTINNMSPSRIRAGMKYRLQFTQDATGGRTVTFGTQYKTNWTPSTTANKVNIIEFVCDGTNWVQQSATVGM